MSGTSLRTEASYIQWIKRFVLFHGKRHPRDMGEPEITAFLAHLAVAKNVAASTQNQALAAILFLYKEVLRHELGWLECIHPATPTERWIAICASPSLASVCISNNKRREKPPHF